VRRHETLRQRLGSGLDVIHRQRCDALWRVVGALLVGGKAWLTGLGRHLSEPGHDKHGIKAVDRLLGNRALHKDRLGVYAAVAAWLLRGLREPILLVDITEIRPGVCALTASVALSGRSLPIYGLLRRKKSINRRRTLNTFLNHLACVVPSSVVPILVTDAGFESPWFDEVQGRGWHYVGRVRHRTRFLWEGTWVGAKELHTLANGHHRNLGPVSFPRQNPCARRLVLSKRPVPKGRRRNNTRGRKGNTSTDKRCRKGASEPWLLATSLSCSADQVVRIYATRMQIEQNYRDTKNHRWGWQMSFSRSRSNQRLENLLLIVALAMLATLAAGAIAEATQHHLRYQANTTRHRRVLSWFFLGVALFQRKDPFLTAARFAQGLREIHNAVQTLDQVT